MGVVGDLSERLERLVGLLTDRGTYQQPVAWVCVCVLGGRAVLLPTQAGYLG